MNPLRSVGARLSLALVVVVAGALGVVYAIVVPSLERNLVHAKLSQLERAVAGLRRQIPRDTAAWPDFVENASASANARVVIFAPLGQTLSPFQDSSQGQTSADVENDSIAERASTTLRAAHGTVTRKEQRYAEAAVPFGDQGHVLLLTASLHDSLGNIHLVQRRLIAAFLLALVASLVVGFGAASAFARRIRRLERAAERIARGEFDQPVSDHAQDELGQLASAFDRMRLRLSQLDHARREFIANASHELRTPLFSLGGFIELLTDEELDEATRREFLETMREQVDRLARLATDLLDLSRLDAGHMRLEQEPVQLADVAQDLCEEFSAVARRRDHPLDVVIEAEGSGLADHERVLQIGRALVDNALLHTPPGTPVRIVARASALAVEDEGPGIPVEHHEQVFARFTRLEGSRASGTGLGLAIARELAARMGGSLELESRPGLTVLTVHLPAFSRENEPRVGVPQLAPPLPR